VGHPGHDPQERAGGPSMGRPFFTTPYPAFNRAAKNGPRAMGLRVPKRQGRLPGV
jgi:uncharacterized RDD family membrane protein YckC